MKRQASSRRTIFRCAVCLSWQAHPQVQTKPPTFDFPVVIEYEESYVA